MLTAIKLSHTIIWAIIAGMILALPALAILRRFRWAGVVTAVVFVECFVLALNRGHCPLTDMAARYTSNRAPNFDIYLPLWLADHNKAVFGALFLAGEAVVLACWTRQRHSASLR